MHLLCNKSQLVAGNAEHQTGQELLNAIIVRHVDKHEASSNTIIYQCI